MTDFTTLVAPAAQTQAVSDKRPQKLTIYLSIVHFCMLQALSIRNSTYFASPRIGGGPLSEKPPPRLPPPGPPRLGSPFLENSTRQGEAAAGGWYPADGYTGSKVHSLVLWHAPDLPSSFRTASSASRVSSNSMKAATQMVSVFHGCRRRALSYQSSQSSPKPGGCTKKEKKSVTSSV